MKSWDRCNLGSLVKSWELGEELGVVSRVVSWTEMSS